MMTSKMRLIKAVVSWPDVSLMHLPLPAFLGIRMFQQQLKGLGMLGSMQVIRGGDVLALQEDDEDNGDEVAYDAHKHEFSNDFINSYNEDPQVEEQNGGFCEIASDSIEDLATLTEFLAGDLGCEQDILDV